MSVPEWALRSRHSSGRPFHHTLALSSRLGTFMPSNGQRVPMTLVSLNSSAFCANGSLICSYFLLGVFSTLSWSFSVDSPGLEMPQCPPQGPAPNVTASLSLAGGHHTAHVHGPLGTSLALTASWGSTSSSASAPVSFTALLFCRLETAQGTDRFPYKQCV